MIIICRKKKNIFLNESVEIRKIPAELVLSRRRDFKAILRPKCQERNATNISGIYRRAFREPDRVFRAHPSFRACPKASQPARASEPRGLKF